MSINTAKPSKLKPVREQEKEEEKETGPFIPSDVLTSFLEGKLTLKEAARVHRVSRRHLWSEYGLERYRINVWARENVDGGFCDSNHIVRSFFLYYDQELSILTDKTL